MKKTRSVVLSSLVLSGAVFVMAPQSWAQTDKGSGSSPSGSQRPDPSASGSKSGTTGSSSSDMKSGTSGSSSSDMQTQRESGSGARSARSGAGQRMSKENIKQVQSALKSKGVDPGPEDGVLGPKTQAAIREFQKSNNLSVTGRLDDKTASALGVDVSSAGSSSSGMGSSSSGMGSSSPGSSGSSSDKGSSSGLGSSSSGASGSGSSTGSGLGSSSSGASGTGTKSGASQSSSGKEGGTSANPPSKPTGKE